MQTEPFLAIPLSPIRKVIAARMSEAKRTIPHFRLTRELEVDALMARREQVRAEQPELRVSLNDLLIKACASALMEVPALNIQWSEHELHQYRSADISVVMALEGGGLSTPIIRRAESKSVFDICREARDLAARAARNALKMEEILGGSFSISNLGMYGVDQFDAIINPPQCAILALGAAKARLVVAPNGGTRVATLMTATLSCDHRAVDGVTGALFLQALRKYVEQPHEAPVGGVQS